MKGDCTDVMTNLKYCVPFWETLRGGEKVSLTTGHSTTNKAHQSEPVNGSRLALHATTAMLLERKACRRR